MSADARTDIHGLMAVAVLGIVLNHAFPALVGAAFVGVDGLLVIAGYLLSSAVLSGLQPRQKGFAGLFARFFRHLVPPMLLVLAAVLAAGWFLLPPADYQLLGRQVVAGSSFVSNAVGWNEATPLLGASASQPLQHLGPLSTGVQFGLLWSLALWAMQRWHLSAVRWTTGVLLLSLLLNLQLAQDRTPAAVLHPLSGVCALLVGGLLASVQAKKPDGRSNARAWIGAALLILAPITAASEQPGSGWWIAPLGTALLIAAGPKAWLNRRLLASKPLVALGLVSVPLYLWHWPLLSFARLKIADEAGGELSLVWAALALVLALALAWATHRFIGQPIRSERRNSRVVAAVLGAGWCLVAAAGWTIDRQGGFEQRVPELVRHLMSHGGRSAVIEGWRDKDCMLDYRLPPSHYKAFCIEHMRPLVFLWGDSHAGSLYPGFRALKEAGRQGFGLAERTAAICPPVLGIEPRPLCASLNEANIQAIRDTRPDVVILYAWWHNKRYDLRNLEATVEQIRQAGVPRIILLGAVPYWKKHLPQILLEEWKKGTVQALPPLRLGEEFLDPELRRATAIMRDRARQMGIEFISGMDFFCNARGCLSRLSEDAMQPLSYDYGHLSTGAAAYYIEQLAPLILNGTR